MNPFFTNRGLGSYLKDLFFSFLMAIFLFFCWEVYNLFFLVSTNVVFHLYDFVLLFFSIFIFRIVFVFFNDAWNIAYSHHKISVASGWSEIDAVFYEEEGVWLVVNGLSRVGSGDRSFFMSMSDFRFLFDKISRSDSIVRVLDFKNGKDCVSSMFFRRGTLCSFRDNPSVVIDHVSGVKAKLFFDEGVLLKIQRPMGHFFSSCSQDISSLTSQLSDHIDIYDFCTSSQCSLFFVKKNTSRLVAFAVGANDFLHIAEIDENNSMNHTFGASIDVLVELFFRFNEKVSKNIL